MHFLSQRLKQMRSYLTRDHAIVGAAFIALFALTVVYRFYQPLTQQALLQFDIFDWARRSQEILTFGQMVQPTSLWVFPAWNALVARITHVELFSIYLFSGAVLTTLNLFLLYGIGSRLWRQPFLRLIPLLLYTFNLKLLSRSVNFLPETMSFSFGLALVYCYLRVILSRRLWWFIPIAVLNYFYYHLHQSGINFLFFSVAVALLYLLFLMPQSWFRRAASAVAFLAIGFAGLWFNLPLRRQLIFFLNGDGNGDVAFQGTPIPFEQFFTDFPPGFYIPCILGAVSLIVLLFRRRPASEKIAWVVIAGIAGFYYSFLYVLPNLKLYSLVPWRFYTWFNLYAILIASQGIAVLYGLMRRHLRLQLLLIVGFIIASMSHANVISDSMYTANAATIRAMRQLEIPSGSIVFTTNANYLQTRFALVGEDVTIREAGPDLFRAADGASANAYAQQIDDGRRAFVLLSLYQLRQRPTSIDYWRNSALYDMDVLKFEDRAYFETISRDADVALYAVRQDAIPPTVER